MPSKVSGDSKEKFLVQESWRRQKFFHKIFVDSRLYAGIIRRNHPSRFLVVKLELRVARLTTFAIFQQT